MRHLWPVALVLAILLPPLPLAAQAPVQVADLNSTRYDNPDNFLYRSEFVDLGGTVYFTASDGLFGLELWKTDGTAAGTVRLTDLCPGSCDSFPRGLTVLGSSIVFAADDGTHGFEPWITNGTAAGTRMILDAVPGLGGSTPNFFRVLGGRVIYGASDPAAGLELWTSDGTAAGTQRLVDVNPGPQGSGAAPWLALGSDVYFSADDGTHGEELWATDGTAAGTRLVLDISPGSNAGLLGLIPVPGFHFFAVLGSRLFFAATEGTNGAELWATDGTAAGTARVADIEPGADGSTPRDFTQLGTKLFFRARTSASGDELWATDGTGPGTALVADIFPGTNSSTPFEMTPFGGSIFFHADNGTHGRELWKTDGAATSMVKDIRPGADSGLEFFFSYHDFTAVGSRLLFFADDGVSGNELWASDGSAAGTAQVANLNPGALHADGGSLFGGREIRGVFGGRWYFTAFGGPYTEGHQIFTSDGTAAGTSLLKRLVEQRSGVALPYFGRILDPHPNAALATKLIFSGDDGVVGGEPAISDGTPAGTSILADVNAGFDTSTPNEMVTLGSRVLMSTGQPSGDRSLWATDGTPGGTAALLPGLSLPSDITAFSGSAYLSASDAAHGTEVWKSDGTPGGTSLAFDLVPGTGSSTPGYFTPAGNKLFFTASDPAAGNELWTTDGATASRLADIRPGPADSFPTQLTVSPINVLSSVVYFTADDGVSGREPWVSDGTAAGTRRVADVRPGPASSMDPSPVQTFAYDSGATMAPLPLNGGVVFAADDGVAGEELWYSSNDVGDTFLLSDIRPGPLPSQPRQMVRVGRRVVFTADHGVWGREVWAATQGVLGASLLADIAPGLRSSVPQHLTSFGGIVLFSADDGVHGREVWMTDGTPQGTRRVTDLAPGPLPSSPYAFASVGGDFYFAATDGTSGFELWRLPRTSLGPRITATKRVSGQFVVGGEVVYTIVLANSGLASQLPTNGVQVEDTIPAGLSFLSATSSSGSIPVVFGGSPVRIGWGGEIPPGGEVTITLRCRVLPSVAPETVIANQALAHADTNSDLIDDTVILTDDPDQPGGQDATPFRVGLGFYTVPPCRAFDSRSGSPLLNGSSQTVPVAGVCGVPATAKSVAINLTAIQPNTLGFLRAYASGSSPGTVSQINFGPGQTRTNNAIAGIGVDGNVIVTAALTFGGVVDFVFDVVGYFE